MLRGAEMRFSVQIHFDNKKVAIPGDYRSHILSLIKEAFLLSENKNENFFARNYSSNVTKPFTFSTFIPTVKDNGNLVLNGDFISFHFSSNDYEYLMRIYNGFLSIKNFELFGSKITLKRFFVHPQKRFTNNMTLKTLSPFLVRSLDNGDYYLVPEEVYSDKFKYALKSDINTIKKALITSINSLSKKYLSLEDEKLEINILKSTLAPSSYSSKNKNGHPFKITLPALKGTLKISTNPQIIEMIYDIGLGARRSEGFGMVEVII